ncbi:hypothetical protein FZEAL_6308 [Fusarium zealandicum]|uniref:Uncharacterized protein n=1 Tax=Fusarium zealandicum TaxID=1053134 RepID=A0A8H4UIT5_9HYPO|nr:hypothetical protein FZEAL_6308 [Fusarium zealandicum]
MSSKTGLLEHGVEATQATSITREPPRWKFALKSWRLECLACLVSIAAVAALIALLKRYDNKSLPTFALGLTLNTPIALLATLSSINITNNLLANELTNPTSETEFGEFDIDG